jgi:hypothetical protein
MHTGLQVVCRAAAIPQWSSGGARGTEVTAGLVTALIIWCCLAISLDERTFDCLRDALLIPDGEGRGRRLGVRAPTRSLPDLAVGRPLVCPASETAATFARVRSALEMHRRETSVPVSLRAMARKAAGLL